MSRTAHALTDIDETARTATCSQCGPGIHLVFNRRWLCGPHVQTRRAAYRHRNRDRIKAYDAARRAPNRKTDRTPTIPAAFLAQASTAQERKKASRLWQRYGISLEDYARLNERQQGRCGICSRDMELVIDHDHETGKVRGLLCGPCNRAIGWFGDTAEGVARAVAYLTT